MDTNTITGKVTYSVCGPESSEQIEAMARIALAQNFGDCSHGFWVDTDGDADGVVISFGFDTSLGARSLDARMDEIGVVPATGAYGKIEVEFADWVIA